MFKAILSDLNCWSRSRGGEVQFHAMDSDIQRWLTSALPDKYGPYFLVGSELIQNKTTKKYYESPFQYDMSQMPKCFQEGRKKDRRSFWIWSKTLTPDLILQEREEIGGICSYNGLILLQHGYIIDASLKMSSEINSINPSPEEIEKEIEDMKSKRTGPKDLRWLSSRIAMTHVMKYLRTGEIRKYDEYLSIYRSLSRAIRKDLKYSNIYQSRDGTEYESKLEMWTEEAVKAYEQGFKFLDRPGFPVKKNNSRKNKLVL